MNIQSSLKTITSILLFTACACVVPVMALSQGKPKNNTYIRLAHVLDNKQSITLTQMQSDSLVLVCVPAGEWTITRMSITLQPEDGAYMGPYVINGPRLTGAEVALLNQYKEQKIKRVKVFVDDIQVLDQNKQLRKGNPITYYIMN